MFSKLKHIKDMRSQAKVMQNVLAQESVNITKEGITVIMNGNMEITKISLDENLAKDRLESILADCVNEAIKKIQRLMAQKMQDMGGFPGLS